MIQDGKPLGFYTRKLSQFQLNYTEIEGKLLGIIEGLKAFEDMLYDQKITVYNIHINLLYKYYPGHQTVWWKQLLE